MFDSRIAEPSTPSLTQSSQPSTPLTPAMRMCCCSEFHAIASQFVVNHLQNLLENKSVIGPYSNGVLQIFNEERTSSSCKIPSKESLLHIHHQSQGVTRFPMGIPDGGGWCCSIRAGAPLTPGAPCWPSLPAAPSVPAAPSLPLAPKSPSQISTLVALSPLSSSPLSLSSRPL